MHITSDVLKQTQVSIYGLLQENHNNIEDAYCNEEDTLTLSIQIKYSLPPKGNGIQVDAALNFVKERIKQKTTAIVDPERDSLIGHIESLRPKKGSGIDSVELSSGDKTLKLQSK
jgi:hypothetical protein